MANSFSGACYAKHSQSVCGHEAAGWGTCKTYVAGFLGRLITQRHEGSNLLAGHLLPALEAVRPQPAPPDAPPLLPLLLGDHSGRAAEEQPEQLPYAVEMHLRERRALSERKQRRRDAEQERQQPQDNAPNQRQTLAPDVHDHAEPDAGSAQPPRPPPTVQPVQHDEHPQRAQKHSLPLQSAARVSGVFARPHSGKRQPGAGHQQPPAATKHAKEQVWPDHLGASRQGRSMT
jgi:hypothetical protein